MVMLIVLLLLVMMMMMVHGLRRHAATAGVAVAAAHCAHCAGAQRRNRLQMIGAQTEQTTLLGRNRSGTQIGGHRRRLGGRRQQSGRRNSCRIGWLHVAGQTELRQLTER